MKSRIGGQWTHWST